jgi:hypothetical protein
MHAVYGMLHVECEIGIAHREIELELINQVNKRLKVLHLEPKGPRARDEVMPVYSLPLDKTYQKLYVETKSRRDRVAQAV